jgi:hypothetical protein
MTYSPGSTSNVNFPSLSVVTLSIMGFDSEFTAPFLRYTFVEYGIGVLSVLISLGVGAIPLQ